MGIELQTLKKQGKDTADGHAEIKIIMKVDGTTTAEAIYTAKIVTEGGRQVVCIDTQKIK